MTVQVANEVVPLAGGPAEKTFAPQEVTVPAGQDAVVKLSEGWANPKLWWPDAPNQYNVVTTLERRRAADRRAHHQVRLPRMGLARAAVHPERHSLAWPRRPGRLRPGR